MIWILMGILVLGALLFVTKPLYVKDAPKAVVGSELTDYISKIKIIEERIEVAGEDKPELEQAKTELQRQLLASTSKTAKDDTGPPALLLASLFVAFGFGAMGLYAMLGNPALTKPGALQKPVMSADRAMAQGSDPQHENNASLEDLIGQLETKLKAGQGGPDGWMLYARSLMNLGRYDEAVTAYEKVLSLTDNNPNVAAELANAKTFIAQQTGTTPATRPPGPSAEQVRDAAQMSDQDRAAMITGMIEGLSQKLLDNPNDIDGWIRLLRARKVMGATEEAKVEIERMKTAFKDSPDTITKILEGSGWSAE